MFRIKTDIRQYRCDTRDKVERLIRNWVIRPTDLIYDDDSDQWDPIGEHPSFVELFDSLAEAHQNQPETVITDRAADKAASDKSEAPSSSSKNSNSQPKSAILRPARSTNAEPPVPSDEVEGVIRDSDEITVMTERTLDILSEERVPADKPPPSNGKAPPTPPPSVEPPATAAPDEKTELVELPTFDDEDETAQDSPPLDESDDLEPNRERERELKNDEEAPEPTHDEDQKESERPDASTSGDDPPKKSDPQDEERDLASKDRDELTPGDDEGAQKDQESEEDADEVQLKADTDGESESLEETTDDKPDGVEPSDEHEPPADDSMAAENAAPAPKQSQPLGRHDLPEEVFVTAEISETETTSDEEHLDELGELGDEDLVMGSPSESRSQWNIILDEVPPDDDKAAAYEETDELELPDKEDVAGASLQIGDDEVDPLRDTADLGPPPTPDIDSDAGGDPSGDPTGDAEEIDPLRDTDEIGIQSRPAPDDDSPRDPAPSDDFEEALQIDEAALDDAFEDLEDSAIAARQASDNGDTAVEELDEISMIEAIPVRDPNAPSLGYEVDFRIPIEPSQELLDRGLQRSQVSEKRRDGLYSLPEPKTSGEIIKKHYYLSNRPSFEKTSSGFRFPAIVFILLIVVSVVMILLGLSLML